MHIIFLENEEEKELNFNKYESIFCPMEKLTKKLFVEKWKTLTNEGKVYTNKESSIVRRLQVHNMVGCALKTVIPDKVVNIYMSCTTKNNILILFELVIMKSNHIFAEVKYRSESNCKEVDFENYLTILLSEVDDIEPDEVRCR